MHYHISYKGDNTGRKAINDLIGWFGLGKSKMIVRALKACNTFGDIDRVDFAITMGGVQGEPVRRLIAHVLGEATLQRWYEMPLGSQALIRDSLYK